MHASILPLALLAGMVAAVPTPLSPPQPFKLIAAESTDNTLAKRNVGGVRLCTGADWTGECWYGIYTLDVCINLNDLYVSRTMLWRGGMLIVSSAGHVLSFRPDEDTECFLMQ